MAMKVLMVNKFLYPNGGSETYIFSLGRELERRGCEVQYFGMEHEGRIVGNHAECYTSNMDFHTGKLQRLLYPFKIIYSVEARRKIRTVLEEFQPDVIHLNNFNFQLTPSIIYGINQYRKGSKKKVKLIMTAHDGQFVCPNHLMRNPVSGERCTKCMDKGVIHCIKGRCIHGSLVKSVLAAIENRIYYRLRTYGHIDQIICPSYFLRDKLKTYLPIADRLIVLHNFVEGFSDGDQKKEERGYVLYFGRYSEEKGIETLLGACRQLPDIPFVFAGDGPLREQVRRLPNIEERGFQTGKALEELIRGARFCVMPSECYENCPFSVIEAQVCHTPVLGARLGGIPELLQEGVTGELFEGGNLKELTEKIDKLWKDKEKTETYSQNCEKLQFDTAESYCEKLLKIYEE